MVLKLLFVNCDLYIFLHLTKSPSATSLHWTAASNLNEISDINFDCKKNSTVDDCKLKDVGSRCQMIKLFLKYIFSIYIYNLIKNQNLKWGQWAFCAKVHLIWPFCTVNASSTYFSIFFLIEFLFIQINKVTNYWLISCWIDLQKKTKEKKNKNKKNQIDEKFKFTTKIFFLLFCIQRIFLYLI